jgi:hypothetical protein
MTKKPRMSWFKKLFIFLIVFSVGVFYFGAWLPQYLLLEEGVSLESKPNNIFLCLLNTRAKNVETSKIREGAPVNLILDIFPQGVVTDFVKDDYMILTDSRGTSLTITIDAEGEAFWLSFDFEQDLGENPLNRIYQNWRRTEKEQSIIQFLADFKEGYKGQCK